jgi:hypothetical protein
MEKSSGEQLPKALSTRKKIKPRAHRNRTVSFEWQNAATTTALVKRFEREPHQISQAGTQEAHKNRLYMQPEQHKIRTAKTKAREGAYQRRHAPTRQLCAFKSGQNARTSATGAGDPLGLAKYRAMLNT